MKTIPKEFVKNIDKCGDNRFIEVRREGTVVIFRREKMDKTFKSYEIHILGIVKQGSPLPGGLFVKEDYEHLASSQKWGKMGWECKNIKQALEFFEKAKQIVAQKELNRQLRDNPETENEELPEVELVPVVHKKRGRKAVVRAEIVFPDGEFTMKQLLEVNTSYTAPTLYISVQDLLGKKIKIERRESSGRGKPCIIYKKL